MYFHLQGRFDREGGKNLPLAGSLYRSIHNSQSCGAGSQGFGSLQCFPRPQAGSWMGSRAAEIRNGAPMGSQSL